MIQSLNCKELTYTSETGHFVGVKWLGIRIKVWVGVLGDYEINSFDRDCWDY